eukprot:gene7195-11511_t
MSEENTNEKLVITSTEVIEDEVVELSPEEQAAKELIEKAEKSLKKSGLKKVFGKSEDPADLYTQAANQYKMAKKYTEAADCFLKVAQLTEKEKVTSKTTTAYINASNAFRVAKDYKQTVFCLNKAAEIQAKSGNASKSGKILADLALEFEKEKMWSAAADAYENCANVFDSVDSKITAFGHRFKEVNCRIFAGEFDRAIYNLESIAEGTINNKLKALSTFRYLFLAALCRLANMKPFEDTDNYEPATIEVKTENERYRDLDVNYADSKQDKFIGDIILEFELQDLESFDESIKIYVETGLLEPYEKECLRVIREHLVKHSEFTDLQ